MRTLCSAILFASLLTAGDVRTSIEKTVPLLQKASPFFWQHTGCISCHHNVLPSMAITAAQDHGFAVDQAAAKDMLNITAEYVGSRADRMFQGLVPPGGEDTMSYVLFALAASHYPGNAGTDAGVRYLKMRQSEDGRWTIRAHRPPLESSSIALTAVTIRVLRDFAPPSQRTEYAKSIARAAEWLDAATPRNTEESTLRILGLVWADAKPATVAKAATTLGKAQREDGGWSQLPTLVSDAYATGQALVALQASGMNTADEIYKKGTAFLIKTQRADGSWFVKSRSEGFQPYFESGFPYGTDQWISAAGTSWAITALALTQPTSLARLK
jgi:N-acyl-D-amino-acid deacylase